ncbi:sulfotransferase 1A2-like isoform X2 [Babylonia areolata]|uniref:sulfotransferase 1A2-like isoform X2 n=1 Tax=Babylonia areolata TaxID=304850 RepID=UPI003FD1BD16
MLNAATKKTVAAHLKDRHGNDIYYGNGGDTWFTPSMHIKDYREHLKKIRHMELRDDDVILASFPRSGTLWHHQILYMLLHNTTDYVGRMEQDHLEWTEFEKLSRPEGPQTYVTHLRYHHLPVPQQAREQKVKVIYCYRNPKDCWVSLYNIARGIQIIPSYEGTWSHFFDLMIDTGYWYGDWFDHVLEWEKAKSDHPDDIFLSCYELMKRDPVGQIMKIDQFLGLNRGRQLCEQIAEACQFSKLKAAKEHQNPEVHGEKVWKKESGGLYRKEKRTVLGPPFPFPQVSFSGEPCRSDSRTQVQAVLP